MLDRIRWKEKLTLVPVAIVILAFTGPFGTFAELGLWGRFAYWTAAVVGVGAVMNLSVYLVATSGWLSKVTKSWVIFGGVALGAIPGTGVIILIERIGFGPNSTDSPLWFIYLAVLAISVAIALADYRNYIFKSEFDDESEGGTATGQALFDRLDPMIGRDLVSLSNQDHYLEVHTTQGKDIVLYRMGDAEVDLQKHRGLRIHRSHWVALGHVKSLRRSGSSYQVVLSDGRVLPVSRPRVKPLRTALADLSSEAPKGI